MSRLQFEITQWNRLEFMLVDKNYIGYGHAINFPTLARSALADGDYHFFIDDVGLSGFEEPTVVTSDEDKIYWHIIEPEPESWYSFRRAHYVESIREALATVLRLHSTEAARRFRGPLNPFNQSVFEELHSLLVAAGNRTLEIE
jgi:hypothetical protein